MPSSPTLRSAALPRTGCEGMPARSRMVPRAAGASFCGLLRYRLGQSPTIAVGIGFLAPPHAREAESGPRGNPSAAKRW